MAITDFSDLHNPVTRQPRPRDCFFCGRPLDLRLVVYWCGAQGKNLFLHPDCARSLGCHLISDGIRARVNGWPAPAKVLNELNDIGRAGDEPTRPGA